MSCCESHGDVDGSRAATPHTEPRKDTKRRKGKEYGLSVEQKIGRECRENLRTSQLQVPSTPTLLINLWAPASVYRDCFHQTAQAINRVAADMRFNKSLGAPFPIPDIKRTSNGLMLHTAGMLLLSSGCSLLGHSDRWCLKSSDTSLCESTNVNIHDALRVSKKQTEKKKPNKKQTWRSTHRTLLYALQGLLTSCCYCWHSLLTAWKSVAPRKQAQHIILMFLLLSNSRPKLNSASELFFADT